MFETKQETPKTNLYVQPHDVVIPIRERRAEDGTKHAELGEPIVARDLWKETANDG